MDYQSAIEYLEKSKCDQNQGEIHQETHDEALELAIEALTKQAFFEGEVSEIHSWFVDNKDCMLDSAKNISNNWFDDANTNDKIDRVDMDYIIEEVVDGLQEGILNVLSSYMKKEGGN